MASDRKITIEVKHSIEWGEGRGRSGSSADNISSRLENLNKVMENLGKSIQSNQDSSEDINKTLAERIAGLNVGVEAFNKSINTSSGTSGFGKLQQALGEYEIASQKYDFSTPNQKTARDMYESLSKKGIKTSEDYINQQGEAAREMGKFTASMKQANMEVNNTTKPSNSLFNIGELLMAAGARAASTYFSVGAGYTQSLIGASPTQYAGLQIGTDIAQRSAISSALQYALPGAALAGGLGLGAAGLAYAATVPISMYTSMQNAAEQSKLSVQMQSAMVNLFGGQTGRSLIPGLGSHDGIYLNASDQVYGSSYIAGVAAQGLPTGGAVSLALGSQRYGKGRLSANDPIVKFLAAYSGATGDDAGSLGSTLMYLSAASGKSPSDVLSMIGGVGAYTGQTAGQVSGLISTLTGSSSLRSLGAVDNFVANSASGGSAFQQAGASFQMSAASQQASENIMSQALFGASAQDIYNNKAGARSSFNRAYDSIKGTIGGVPIRDFLAQATFGGPAGANAIINAPMPTGQYSGQQITPSQVNQNQPDAYAQAVKDATINASGRVTILTRGVSAPGGIMGYIDRGGSL